jgi:nucleoside-diphosphate-sugar epimerase
MRVLVTGADGYIGAVLCPILAGHGHAVVGLDTRFYAAGLLYPDLADRPAGLRRDTRDVGPTDLAGFDAVVHLAELSNDPLGALSPTITREINHRGSMTLARAARAAGVRRFVYASSCSVYGAGGSDVRTETSPTAPLTEYAACKLACEADLAAMAAEGFATTCLRNATAFGASPRMRFDIVLNNLCGLAATTGLVAMTSDGTPWRPLVHVRDIARAVALVLEAPEDRVRGEILNVGDDDQNLRVREIADIVGDVYPDCRITYGPSSGDDRSYRVSFARIRSVLPGFACRHTVVDGAREMRALFDAIGLDRDTFGATPFTRLAELRRLLGAGLLDASFRWRVPSPTPHRADERSDGGIPAGDGFPGVG